MVPLFKPSVQKMRYKIRLNQARPNGWGHVCELLTALYLQKSVACLGTIGNVLSVMVWECNMVFMQMLLIGWCLEIIGNVLPVMVWRQSYFQANVKDWIVLGKYWKCAICDSNPQEFSLCGLFDSLNCKPCDFSFFQDSFALNFMEKNSSTPTSLKESYVLPMHNQKS